VDVPRLPGYLVEERIGAGGSGVVWRARRERDGRTVAVKVLPLDPADSTPQQAVQRAARELGLMQARVSEHIVRCHEALALLEPVPAIAIVMDHLPGGSLVDVVGARGHFSVGETVTVVSPIARALAGLHAHGVVHADVSPGNVLFDRSGRPWLADFGVAVVAGESSGPVFATHGFTAPEIEMGHPPSAAGDVFALGGLAWFCLSGRPPEIAPLRPSLHELVPGISEEVSRLVTRCQAGDPDIRPTAAEAAVAFFDVAPAAPIRLVTAEDEVSLVTRRIRAAAVSASPAEPAGNARAARSWTRLVPRLRPLDQGSRRALIRGAAAVAVVAAVSAVGWSRLAAADTAAGVSDRSRTRTAGLRSPVSATARVPAAERPDDVLADALAVRSRAVEVITALSVGRARAWNSGDEDLLSQYDAPGSAALSHDREVLREALAGGARYQGVGFRVVSARVMAATTTSARVVARVDPTAYDLVVGDRVTQVPTAPSLPLEFRLRWVDGAWRVAEVRPATAPS
jgi:hypothetical protein